MRKKIVLFCSLAIAVLCALSLAACNDGKDGKPDGDSGIKVEDLAGFTPKASESVEIGQDYAVEDLEVSDASGKTYYVQVSAKCDNETVSVVSGAVKITSFSDYTVTYSVTVGDNTFSKSTVVSVTDTTKPVIVRGGVAFNPYFGEEMSISGFSVMDNSGENITPEVKVKADNSNEYLTVTDNKITVPAQNSGAKKLSFEVSATDSHGNTETDVFDVKIMRIAEANNFTPWENFEADTLSVSGTVAAKHPSDDSGIAAAENAISEREIKEFGTTGVTGLELTLPIGVTTNSRYAINLANNAKLEAFTENIDEFGTLNFVFYSSLAVRLTAYTGINDLSGAAFNTYIASNSKTDANGFSVWTIDKEAVKALKESAAISANKCSLTLCVSVPAPYITTKEETLFIAGIYGGFSDISISLAENETADIAIDGFNAEKITYKNADGTGSETEINKADYAEFTLASGNYVLCYYIKKDGYADTVIERNFSVIAHIEENDFAPWVAMKESDYAASIRKNGSYTTDAGAVKEIVDEGGKKALKLTAEKTVSAASTAPLIFKLDLAKNSFVTQEQIGSYDFVTIEIKSDADLAATGAVKIAGTSITYTTEVLSDGYTAYTFPISHNGYGAAPGDILKKTQFNFLISLKDKNDDADKFVYVRGIYGTMADPVFAPWSDMADNDYKASVRKNNSYTTDAIAVKGIVDEDGKKALKLTAEKTVSAASTAPLIFKLDLASNSVLTQGQIQSFDFVTIEIKSDADLAATGAVKIAGTSITYTTEVLSDGYTAYTFPISHTGYGTVAPSGILKKTQFNFLISLKDKNDDADKFVYVRGIYGTKAETSAT